VKKTLTLLTLLLPSLFLMACSQEKTAKTNSEPVPVTAAPATPQVESGVAKGTVTETMNSGGYTYVAVNTGSETIWAATPETPVKVGESVVIPEGTPMRNFHSPTLNRDFSLIYFVKSIHDEPDAAVAKDSQTPPGHPGLTSPSATAGHALTAPHSSPAGLPPGHPTTTVTAASAQVDVSDVEKVEGGRTVGELYAGRADLSGKQITLRGKVVKFSPQIMGKNWIHLQDGSGDAAAKTNDLVVTTDATAKVGDTVLVSGQIVVDKDFGFGYKYPVIIENAKVTAE